MNEMQNRFIIIVFVLFFVLLKFLSSLAVQLNLFYYR